MEPTGRYSGPRVYPFFTLRRGLEVPFPFPLTPSFFHLPKSLYYRMSVPTSLSLGQTFDHGSSLVPVRGLWLGWYVVLPPLSRRGSSQVRRPSGAVPSPSSLPFLDRWNHTSPTSLPGRNRPRPSGIPPIDSSFVRVSFTIVSGVDPPTRDRDVTVPGVVLGQGGRGGRRRGLGFTGGSRV